MGVDDGRHDYNSSAVTIIVIIPWELQIQLQLELGLQLLFAFLVFRPSTVCAVGVVGGTLLMVMLLRWGQENGLSG